MTKHFRWLVLALCCGYLALQVRYIVGLPLVMDEFANAGHVFRLTSGIPYRDYVPYKTVVGYSLLLPALLAFESSWTAMMAAKIEIACLTTVALAAAALRLRRHFAGPAIVGALLLLVTQSTFLERASELRVDMLSALLGLVSLLAYLERRSWLAGAAAGCAVLMTQKGAYFVLALGGATLLDAARCRARALLGEGLRAGAAASVAVGGYIALGCWVGSVEAVSSIWLGPQRIAFATLYSLDRFWWQTLERNPVFYATALAGLVLLLPSWRARTDTTSGRLWSYSLVLTVLCAWHKQPWPYFFVMLIPTAWVLAAAVLHQGSGLARWWSLALTALVVLGASSSLLLRAPAVLERSSLAQRRVVEGAEAFLQPGETYLAGTELLWRHRHMKHLSWLDQPHLAGLRQQSDEALGELRDRPPRLLIDNYRVVGLPEPFQQEFVRSFADVGGNLYTYAPRLEDGLNDARYAHGGLYRVMGAAGAQVRVDGAVWLAVGDSVRLDAGAHRVEASGGARLVSWSEAPAFVAQTNRPLVNLFERVYTY